MADLSGIASVYVHIGSMPSANDQQTMDKLGSVHQVLVKVIGSSVPRAVVFRGSIVSPARYAATHQYQHKVRSGLLVHFELTGVGRRNSGHQGGKQVTRGFATSNAAQGDLRVVHFP